MNRIKVWVLLVDKLNMVVAMQGLDRWAEHKHLGQASVNLG